jgi:hypothetical protein
MRGMLMRCSPKTLQHGMLPALLATTLLLLLLLTLLTVLSLRVLGLFMLLLLLLLLTLLLLQLLQGVLLVPARKHHAQELERAVRKALQRAGQSTQSMETGEALARQR